MKKRTWIAMLAMSMVFATTACGASGTPEVTDETAQAAEDKAETDEGKKAEGFGDRLVSVDNVEKYIKLADYKGLELEKPDTEVTQEQIDMEIQYRLQNTMEEVTEANATAQNGDTVTINYVGTKDGIAFEGGSADNYDLTLGEGGMIEGFEEGIVGMKKGETKDLDLTFPENYFEESLAGEAVVFQITVQKIQRAPELSDEWVAANSDVSTVDEYYEVIEQELKASAEESAQYALENDAWYIVYDNSEVVEYPEADIENAKAEFEDQVMQYAGDTSMTLEEFVESQGLSMDDFHEQCQQYAESKVKQNLIVQGILDAEKIDLEDEESQAIRQKLIDDFMVGSLEELEEIYGHTAVQEAIAFMRVEKFMADNANVSVEVVDANEYAQSDEVILEDEEDLEEVQDEDLEDAETDIEQTADETENE